MLRDLTTSIDAWTANGVRYPMAAILYWPLLYVAWRSARLDRRLVRRCAWPAIFALGGQVFWALAHYDLRASEVSFLVRMSMLWTFVGAMLLFPDERTLLRRPGFYLGMLLIIVGFLGVAMPDRHQPVGNTTLGLAWISLCAAFFGLYMVSVRRCIPDVDPVLAFGVVAQLVSLGTFLGLLLWGDFAVLGKQTPHSWTLLVGSAVLGIALGHILVYTAVQRLGAAVTSSCQSLIPFVTAILATATLGETLTLRQWLGGIVLVTGATTLLLVKQVVAAPAGAVRTTPAWDGSEA